MYISCICIYVCKKYSYSQRPDTKGTTQEEGRDKAAEFWSVQYN